MELRTKADAAKAGDTKSKITFEDVEVFNVFSLLLPPAEHIEDSDLTTLVISQTSMVAVPARSARGTTRKSSSAASSSKKAKADPEEDSNALVVDLFA